MFSIKTNEIKYNTAFMNTNFNNIFITIVTRPNSIGVLENDFHLYGYTEYKKNLSVELRRFEGLNGKIIFFLWQLLHDKYELLLTRDCRSCTQAV